MDAAGGEGDGGVGAKNGGAGRLGDAGDAGAGKTRGGSQGCEDGIREADQGVTIQPGGGGGGGDAGEAAAALGEGEEGAVAERVVYGGVDLCLGHEGEKFKVDSSSSRMGWLVAGEGGGGGGGEAGEDGSAAGEVGAGGCHGVRAGDGDFPLGYFFQVFDGGFILLPPGFGEEVGDGEIGEEGVAVKAAEIMLAFRRDGAGGAEGAFVSAVGADEVDQRGEDGGAAVSI